MRWAGNVAQAGRTEHLGKSQEKGSFGRFGRKLEDIKIDYT